MSKKNFSFLTASLILSLVVFLSSFSPALASLRRPGMKGTLFLMAFEEINGVRKPYQGTFWACEQDSPYQCYPFETSKKGRGKIKLFPGSYILETFPFNRPESGVMCSGIVICSATWEINPPRFYLAPLGKVKATALRIVECHEMPPLENPE